MVEGASEARALDEQWIEVEKPGEDEAVDTCDPVARYRWWAQGTVQDVELICGTYKKVVFKKDNGYKSPPNGDWEFSRGADGMGKFVVTFHHMGKVEHAKKHVLYEDPKARNTTFVTKNWRRNQRGRWEWNCEMDVVMWPRE